MQFLLVSRKATSSGLAALICVFVSLSNYALCPDLREYYPILDRDPSLLDRLLSNLLEDCYENSEYFALLGSAQIQMGELFRALENLERSLLLDPQNGSAAFDYAEVLFRQGQVISALEINNQLS